MMQLICALPLSPRDHQEGPRNLYLSFTYWLVGRATQETRGLTLRKRYPERSTLPRGGQLEHNADFRPQYAQTRFLRRFASEVKYAIANRALRKFSDGLAQARFLASG
jgi:hypothetical protein